MANGIGAPGDVFSASARYMDDGYCRIGNVGNGCFDPGGQAAGSRQFLHC